MINLKGAKTLIRIYTIECDWKECFEASDVNDALGHVIGRITTFYNVYQNDVDSHVMIVANTNKLTEEQIQKIWEVGDLTIVGTLLEGRFFHTLLKAVKDHVDHVEEEERRERGGSESRESAPQGGELEEEDRRRVNCIIPIRPNRMGLSQT